MKDVAFAPMLLDFLTVGKDVKERFSEILTLKWICNPPAWKISIFHAIVGLKILIFNASGLQIPTNITNITYLL